MERNTKILIAILIIASILLIGYITYICIQNKQESNEIKQEASIENNTIEQNITNEIDVTDTENTIEENPQNDIMETPTVNTVISAPEEQPQVIGQEEQESVQESGTENPEEKAIKLAKEKWGETSESYIFSIDHIEDNIYHIAVIANAMTIGYIDVNIETGETTEL